MKRIDWMLATAMNRTRNYSVEQEELKMLTARGNFHHSKLPEAGNIGRISGVSNIDPRRKCIVSHYPLCDNILPYSIGIHTVFVRFLDNQEIKQVSGFLFRESPET